MNFSRELDDLSRGQLYDVINGLKGEIGCLKIDLIKYKFVSNRYQKYFNFFIQINETIVSNEEVLDSLKQLKLLKSLTERKCFVALKRLSDNYFNENNGQPFGESVEQNSNEIRETIESQEIEGQNQFNDSDDTSEQILEQKDVKIVDTTEDNKQEVEAENQNSFEVNNCVTIDSMIETQPKSDETIVTSLHSKNNSELNISDIEIIEEIPNLLNQTLNQQIMNNETQRDDNSEEIPEQKTITIKSEDTEEENNSITDSLIERKPNIEEIKVISINSNNVSEINIKAENVCDIEFNSRTGHQLYETLNQTIVKTETQRDDNLEEVSNESQDTIEAIKECKPEEEEECIECIDITDNDSDSEQVIDRCDGQQFDQILMKAINQSITQTTKNLFICDICFANLKSRDSLRRHKNRHTDKFLCNVEGCEYRGSRLGNLKGHMKSRHGITDPISDNPEDNNSSLVQMSGNRFITQIQNNSKLGFKCEVCSAIFKTRNSLLNHKNKYTKKFSCGWDDCTFRGCSPFELRRHRIVSHSQEIIFNYFEDSNKRIKTENNSNECSVPQKIQISDKTQEKNNLNDICFQPNDQIMKNDIQLETGRASKVFECDVKGCEKVCNTSRGMRYHMNTHSDKYLCGINGCQLRTSSIYALDRHKRTAHSNEKPYKCVVNDCDNRFKTRTNLKAKEIRGNKLFKDSNKPKIKRFDCLLKYCEQSFSSRKSLRKHMKGTHKLTTNLVNIYFKKYDKSRVVKETQILDNNYKTTNPSDNQRTNDSNKEIEVIELDDEYEEKPLIENELKINKTNENISLKRIRSEGEMNEESDEERAKNLMDHKSNEMPKKKANYVCDHYGCVKRLNSALTLRAHKERHNEVVHKCFWSNCSAVFNNTQRFRKHLIKHTCVFKCNWSGCRYRGTSAFDLRTHKIRHLEDRPLFCSVCNKMFYKRHLLKEHQMAVHQMFNECKEGLENK